MRYGYLLSVVCLMQIVLCFPASAITEDSLEVKKKEIKYDYIILSGKYNNAFTFLERDFGQSTPFLSSDIMYYFNSGWFIDVSGFKFLQPGIPLQTSVSLGFQKALSKKTDLSLSYSQFLVADKSTAVGIQNAGYLQTTFGLDWKILYSTIQLQGLFNENPDFFISTTHSRYFEFDQKLFKAFTVSFEPKLTVVGGTSRFYLLGGYSEIDDQVAEDLEKVKLIGWDFSLPVTFSINYFELEFQAKYVSPLNVPEFDPSVNRLVFGVELGYYIPVKKMKK